MEYHRGAATSIRRRGRPGHLPWHLKSEQAAILTHVEVKLMRLYSALQQHARDYAKEQRQKVGVRQ